MRSKQNLKKSSSWCGRLLSKCTNHEEDFFNFFASQNVRALHLSIYHCAVLEQFNEFFNVKTNNYLSFIEEFTMEHFHMLTMRLERSVQANYQCQIWFVIFFASQRRSHLFQKLHNFLDWKLEINIFEKIKIYFQNYQCQIWFVIIFASQRRRHLLQKLTPKGYFEPNVLYETSKKWDRKKPTQINIQSSCAILVVKNLTLRKILPKSVHN